jgi:hypothetical protein
VVVVVGARVVRGAVGSGRAAAEVAGVVGGGVAVVAVVAGAAVVVVEPVVLDDGVAREAVSPVAAMVGSSDGRLQPDMTAKPRIAPTRHLELATIHPAYGAITRSPGSGPMAGQLVRSTHGGRSR